MRRIIKFALTALLCVCSILAFTACEETTSFTVKFDANGGVLVSGVETQVVESASEIEVPVYEREGYDFVGWNQIISQIDKDTTVKAQWRIKPFTVMFDGNGGTLVSGEIEQLVYKASDIVLPTFVKKGYSLQWDTDVSSITGATTVKAVWIANEYLLTFDLDGGEMSGEMANGKTVVFGEPIGELPTPTKSGYDFNYWQIGSSLINANTIWEFDSNMTAEAEYLRETEYMIRYDLDGGRVSSNPNKYTKSSLTFTLNNPTRTGYEFKGWLDQDKNQTLSTVTIEKGSTGDRSFKAQWEAKTYEVLLDAKLGTSEKSSITVKYDALVGELPTCSLVDYEFLGWYLGEEKITEDTVWKTDGQVTLTAEYLQADEYSITYVLNGGKVSSNPNKYTEYSSTFTLNNPTKDGYKFIGWTFEGQSTPKLSVTIVSGTTGNLTFTANWLANQYLLTLDADEGILAEEYLNGIVVTFGEKIGQLPVPNKVGFVFDHWSVGSEQINKDTVWTYFEGQTAIAIYVKEPEYSITYELQGGGGTTNPSSYKKSDASFTLNNPTKTGHDFIGWTYGEVTDPQVIVTIETGTTGNLVFTANWHVRSYTVELDAGEGSCQTDKITVTYGQEIGELPTCTREGHKFDGWYLDGVKVNENTVWTIDGAKKLVAQYKIDLHVKIVLSCQFRGELVSATVNGQSEILISVEEGQTLQGLLPDKASIIFMDPEEFSFNSWVNVNGVKVTENTKITAENFPDITTGIITITIKCQSVNTKFY